MSGEEEEQLNDQTTGDGFEFSVQPYTAEPARDEDGHPIMTSVEENIWACALDDDAPLN